jgi:glyoxylase-like metal-dependent hydrolase (beta-lactamase superfamily II)
VAALLALVIATVPLTRGVAGVDAPPASAVVTTSGVWASMIFLFRTSDGIGVVDLGWWGAEHALDRGLRELGATRSDVRVVFLTHSHRDHIAAWPLLPGARYVLARPELDLLQGSAVHRGLVPRLAESVWPTRRPRAGALAITTFERETSFVLGGDTIRAVPVAGHTPGSAAYLVRGVLFAGDALNWRPMAGFRGARPEMSDDPSLSARNLGALLRRLGPGQVRTICSAHAKCTPFDAGLAARLSR